MLCVSWKVGRRLWKMNRLTAYSRLPIGCRPSVPVVRHKREGVYLEIQYSTQCGFCVRGRFQKRVSHFAPSEVCIVVATTPTLHSANGILKEARTNVVPSLKAERGIVAASGNRNNGSGGFNNVGSNGNYWSFAPISQTNARNLNFNSGNINPLNNNNRSNGFSVRASRAFPK